MNNYELLAIKSKELLDLTQPEEGYNDDDNEFLSMNIINAVYSLRARYTAAKNVKNRFEAYCNDNSIKMSNLDCFIKFVDEYDGGFESIVENIIKNKQTFGKKVNNTLKIEVCYALSKALLCERINTTEDLLSLYNKDSKKLGKIITSVKWIGPAAKNYILMGAGITNLCKVDTHIKKYINDIGLNNVKTDDEYQNLFRGAVEILKKDYPEMTVRHLDQIIWKKYSNK